MTHFPYSLNWSFCLTKAELLWCGCLWALRFVQRQTPSLRTFMSPQGAPAAPNLCPGELTLLSPPELYLGVGHLRSAAGERLLLPCPNPGESIDASMAGGLCFTQEPQGEQLISINVKWCCSQANKEDTHTSVFIRICTYPHMWCGVRVYADAVVDWLSWGQNIGARRSDVVKWQASEWNICSLDAVDASLLPR